MGPTKLRIFICVLFLVIVALVSLAISYRTTPVIPAIEVALNFPDGPVAIGSPLPQEPAEPAATATDSSFVGRLNLIIPVAGVRPEQLIDTFAHLSGYAAGLAEGDDVRQGQVIAYVGDTGNAGTGNFHLHFSIAVVSDPKRYWEGTNINPYPLLQNRAR